MLNRIIFEIASNNLRLGFELIRVTTENIARVSLPKRNPNICSYQVKD